jgi:hypothetical protein
VTTAERYLMRMVSSGKKLDARDPLVNMLADLEARGFCRMRYFFGWTCEMAEVESEWSVERDADGKPVRLHWKGP